MSCLAILLLALIVTYFSAAISFFLAVGAVPLAILCLILIPLAILFIWRIIYPWLVRMGRWSAQIKNIVFLAFVLLAVVTVLSGQARGRSREDWVLDASGLLLQGVAMPLLQMTLLYAFLNWMCNSS